MVYGQQVFFHNRTDGDIASNIYIHVYRHSITCPSVQHQQNVHQPGEHLRLYHDHKVLCDVRVLLGFSRTIAEY